MVSNRLKKQHKYKILPACHWNWWMLSEHIRLSGISNVCIERQKYHTYQ